VLLSIINFKSVSAIVSGTEYKAVGGTDQGVRIFTMIDLKSNTYARRYDEPMYRPG
jgi:hypothetical protein